MKPVSYTHLDVYKRQNISRANLKKLGMNSKNNIILPIIGAGIIFSICIGTLEATAGDKGIGKAICDYGKVHRSSSIYDG